MMIGFFKELAHLFPIAQALEIVNARIFLLQM
jgi:hypothetical protein